MDSIKYFILEAKKYIAGNRLGDNYCVIVYTTFDNVRDVRLIYKTIDDFESRVEKDIQNIDSMFGIDFRLWIYD